MKLICYELNEVPWSVIDDYVTKKPYSTLAQILQSACQLTTMTHDSGELTPFFTWPTLHRGVYNDVHKILFMNQDIVTDYPPIWELLAQNNYKVGVFGSLHSWPIPKNQQYSFYIPHTFAQDAQTFPANFEVFQAFNLEQTKRDGGSVVKKVNLHKYGKTLLKLLGVGMRWITAWRLLKHLVAEKINPDHKTFRSAMQAPIAFDFYWKLLSNTQPNFSCFFTNHVAGMMHRYWKYAYPTSFSYQLSSKRDFFLAKNIEKAMDLTDEQLTKLKGFCDQHDYTLFIVSSMGQEAIHRDAYKGELRIVAPDLFIQTLGFSGKVENKLSMQPYFAFLCNSSNITLDFQDASMELTDEAGKCLFTHTLVDNTINLRLKGYSQKVIKNKQIYFKGKPVDMASFGIDIVHRDVGTGYHKPEGIAIFYGHSVKTNSARNEVETTQILPTLLDCFAIKKRAYMAPSFYNDVFLNQQNA